MGSSVGPGLPVLLTGPISTRRTYLDIPLIWASRPPSPRTLFAVVKFKPKSPPTRAPTYTSLGDTTGAGVPAAVSPAQKQASDRSASSAPVPANDGPSGKHFSS